MGLRVSLKESKRKKERKAVEQNFKMVVQPKKKIRGGIKEVHRNDFNLEMLFAESVVY